MGDWKKCSCWYCRYPLKAGLERRERLRQPSFAGFPISLEGRPDGRYHFRLHGFFHDLGCLRAWIGQRNLTPIQRGVLMDYCRLEWHMSALPPPAPPHTQLRKFGGRFRWSEWRERAGECARDWRMADDAVRYGQQHGSDLASMMQMDAPTVRTCPPKGYRPHEPGYNDSLDEYLT